MAENVPPGGGFRPVDEALLRLLAAQNVVLRAVLCTLARRGVAFRQRDPDRARMWLDALAVHPLFKGGQFLFDLLEWEDFMLDGEPPPLIDGAALAAVLDLVKQGLDALRQAIEGEPVATLSPVDIPSPTDLPPLEAGFTLYRDVVLGLLDAALGTQTVDTPGAA